MRTAFVQFTLNQDIWAMKKCPFCAEDIQDEAIKCKHCGEFLSKAVHPPAREEGVKWYFRKAFIVIAVLCVGPLALPLIWWRPRTTRAWKIGLTVGILVLSCVLFQVAVKSLQALKQYYELLGGLRNG